MIIVKPKPFNVGWAGLRLVGDLFKRKLVVDRAEIFNGRAELKAFIVKAFSLKVTPIMYQRGCIVMVTMSSKKKPLRKLDKFPSVT